MTSINGDDTGSLPDLDMDFDTIPETNPLQAVADSMAHDMHQHHQHQHHGLSKERSPSTSGNEKDGGDSDRGSGKKRSSPTPPEDLNAPAGKITKRRAARACVRYV